MHDCTVSISWVIFTFFKYVQYVGGKSFSWSAQQSTFVVDSCICPLLQADDQSCLNTLSWLARINLEFIIVLILAYHKEYIFFHGAYVVLVFYMGFLFDNHLYNLQKSLDSCFCWPLWLKTLHVKLQSGNFPQNCSALEYELSFTFNIRTFFKSNYSFII